MDALTDLAAGEQNDVLQTLSEQETPISELVRRVFSQVQTEFTTWNVVRCHQILTSFAAPSTWQSCLHPDLRSPASLAFTVAASKSSPDARLVASEANSPSLLVSQEMYSPDGVVTEISSVKLDVIHLSSSLEPHPPYESCSPLHRSVFKGDDSDNMDFIPYADDDTFDQTSHTHHYGSFSWQGAFDPDLEIIVLEAVYRLQVQHALTYDEIEDCDVLPLKLRSQPGISGLLSTARRRDRLHWAGNTIPASYIFPPPTWREGSNFRNRLKTLNSFFCAKLSCVEPLCSVHVEPNPMPLKPQPPVFHVLGEVTSPCRNQCFINNKTEEAGPSWDEADLDVFKVIFEISPNATPCDLAELCLKPCYEVFYYGNLLRPCNSDEAQTADIKSQRRMLKFNDNNPTQFTPLALATTLATIPAPATVLSAVHVSKINRIVNATVAALQNAIADGKVVVAQELGQGGAVIQNGAPVLKPSGNVIQNCASTADASDDTPCRNSQLQRGTRKELEVKQSSWGLGTFLAEAAKAGDLISEYIGELIYDPTVESRGDLATHRNRCYVFGLNNTFSLDSTYGGNMSRFINHSDAEQSRRVNSQARVRLVNGDHRIGIFAIRDMEAGSEVLMDYGSQFFIK